LGLLGGGVADTSFSGILGVAGDAAPMLSRAERRLELPLRDTRLRGPAALEIEGARVLEVRDGCLVIEFEVPVAGLMLPEGKVRVEFVGTGRHRVAKVVRAESTPAGPHDLGVTVRLGLRLAKGKAWPGPDVVIVWTGVARDEGRKLRLGRITMPVRIPGERRAG
jgi:hypothetical protein